MFSAKRLALLTAAITLCSCGEDAAKKLAEAQPAKGEALDSYAQNMTHFVHLGDNADLIQRFCQSAWAKRCPDDLAARLKTYGYTDGETGLQLAYAMSMIVADEKDGTPDQMSTDEVYLDAAYQVALGRKPDEDGGRENLAFIKQKEERQLMLRTLLQSREFMSLQ